MPISEIIKFCDSIYLDKYRNPANPYCDDCKNDYFCKTVTNFYTGSRKPTCNKCVQDFTNPKENKLKHKYPCKNSTLFYVCKYIQKYASEIKHLLNEISWFNDLPRYDILSIGCGPSTELYGIISYLQSNNIYKSLIYIGSDVNDNWAIINAKNKDIIESIYKDSGIYYFYNGNLSFNSDSEPWYPNILILNYVISHIYLDNQYNQNVNVYKEFEDFFCYIINSVVTYMPQQSIIILNDMDHGLYAREHFEYFYSKLCEYFGKRLSRQAFCFKENRGLGLYGDLHKSKEIIIEAEISEKIISNFDIRVDCCGSAQLVIYI